jgi:tRNA-dihydrouridine synthase 1
LCLGADQDVCPNIAAQNCPRTACLTHCRAKGGLDAGLATDMEQALKLSQGGKLTGHGCEAHEEKDQARKLRKAEKNKAYKELKAARRNKRNRAESVEPAEGKHEDKKVKTG